MKSQMLTTLALIGFLSLATRAHGELFTVVLCTDTNSGYATATNILVSPGSILEWGAVNGVNVAWYLPDSPGSTNFTRRLGYSTTWNVQSAVRAVVGPALVEISLGGGADLSFCTLKITKQGETFTPSTAVVIPSDAQGPVDIVLESSTNLVQWTQALPGTYGTSSQLRYFRVRAVQK